MAPLPDLTIEPSDFSTILDRPPFLLPGVVFALRSTLPRFRYALICFYPDAKDGKPHVMHGMLKEITVR